MIFFIYNTFWKCYTCDEPELCGVIDALPSDARKIRDISELLGEKIKKSHCAHHEKWMKLYRKDCDSNYEDFLKENPKTDDTSTIKDEFMKQGFVLIGTENKIRIGEY